MLLDYLPALKQFVSKLKIVNGVLEARSEDLSTASTSQSYSQMPTPCYVSSRRQQIDRQAGGIAVGFLFL